MKPTPHSATQRDPVQAHSPPPPIKSRRGRLALLAGAGAIVAIMLLLIVFNIDRQLDDAKPSLDDSRLTELIPPDTLTQDDLKGELGTLKDNFRELGAENTWIQTTKDGKLAQQYRFASHDPSPAGLPPGFSKVIKPEIQLYMSDDRVVTLQSDSALLRAPAQNVESGSMTGDVIIRMYEIDPSQRFDETTDVPILEAKTHEASFDNVQGEIRCDGHVDIQTATAHLPGRGLRVQINELEDRVEWLRMETVDVIRLAAAQDEASGADDAAIDADEELASSAQSPPPNESPSAAALAQPAINTAEDAPSSPRKRPAQRKRNRKNASQTPLAIKPIEPPFYHLTLHENVHIQQGNETEGWTAQGTDLHIIFSMESKAIGKSLAKRSTTTNVLTWAGTNSARHGQRDTSLASHSTGMSMHVAVASLVIAASSSDGVIAGIFQPSDDDIIITCDGGMTMVPLVNAAERPASTEDARMELIGAPLRLRSFADHADVTCHTLLYHSLAQRVVLKASTDYPLTIESPELRSAGEQFWLSRIENIGGFDGAGWMIMRETDEAAPLPASPNHGDPTSNDFRIQWVDRVDLAFGDSAKGGAQSDRKSLGKLQTAAFAGNVEVTSDEVFLRSDRLVAQFPKANNEPAASDNRSIESVVATGAVKALSLTDQGSLACENLNVQFARAADGRTVPTSMVADGEVMAVDPDRQTIWSDTLTIAFNPPSDAAATAPESASIRPRSAQVKSLTATNHVQVLMADGTRAFADTLQADARTEVVVLTGDDVMVLSDTAVIHHGTRMELHKADSSAHWPGPGTFLSFANPIVDLNAQRITKPAIDQIDAAANPVQVRANWQHSMLYNGQLNDGAGALTLTGNVDAESWPTPLEHNTLKGQSVTMHFQHAPVESADPSAAQPDAPAISAAADGRSRQLKLFIAQGDAKLESHTWLKQDRSDTSRVFYVAGPDITYDNQTLESRVNGAGTLLVRDEQIASEPTASSDSRPFSAKGTTQFTWSDHLHMTQQQASLYDIEMIGDVQVLHQALDKTTSTFLGRELHATVERMATTSDNTKRNDGFDLGGAMELRRLRGSGGVYIHSPGRDIDCEDFDYDYTTGIATMSALPGRYVTVKSANNPHPQRARLVIWDIINDKITLKNASGTGPR